MAKGGETGAANFFRKRRDMLGIRSFEHCLEWSVCRPLLLKPVGNTRLICEYWLTTTIPFSIDRGGSIGSKRAWEVADEAGRYPTDNPGWSWVNRTEVKHSHQSKSMEKIHGLQAPSWGPWAFESTLLSRPPVDSSLMENRMPPSIVAGRIAVLQFKERSESSKAEGYPLAGRPRGTELNYEPILAATNIIHHPHQSSEPYQSQAFNSWQHYRLIRQASFQASCLIEHWH